MPRGKRLSEFEKGKITGMRQDGKSYRAIAKALKRSRHVVKNYLDNPDNYGTKRRPGRPRKLTARDQRSIIKSASNSTISCQQIKQKNKLPVSRTTVWRALKRSNVIIRAKMKRAPALNDSQRAARVEFAKRNWYTCWEKVRYYFVSMFFVVTA